MYLAQLLRGYILLVVGKLLAPPPAQQVFNSSLPSVCTSQIVNPYLAQVPAGAWRKAFGRDDASSIIDISIPLGRGTVDWESDTGLDASFRTLDASQQLGDRFTGSFLRMSAHTGTHIDSPGHFVWDAYASGKGMESLDLEVLNGPALVVEVAADTNLTAAAVEQLNIPHGVTRVLFKTLNTRRKLMHQQAFDTSYVAFTQDGAAWLVQHRPDVRLVGLDYLSVAIYEDVVGPHVALLGNGIIAVEGLVMDKVPAGLYQLHCLPLSIAGSDGSPARCILLTM